MFRYLYENAGIPFAEAADFFVMLKTAGVAPPDETGTLEGVFIVPLPIVLEQLGKMVQTELKTNYAYLTYANSLRDLTHHAIAEEFEAHADEEVEHADWLLQRMGVLGGPIQVPDIPAPEAVSDPIVIVRILVRMEQEGIQGWRTLHAMLGENPMKFKVEEYMVQEQQHLDELWQLLPHETEPPVPVGATAEPSPEEAPVEVPYAAKSASARFQQALQKLAASEEVDKGKSRALGNASASFESKHYHRGQTVGDVVGRFGGAAAGGLLGRKYGKNSPLGPLVSALGGAILGQHVGGYVGRGAGGVVDELRFKHKHADSAPLTTSGIRQSEELPVDHTQADVVPSLPPEVAKYVQQEQAARAGAAQEEDNYYKQRFQQAAQQLIQMQQAQQANQEQMGQMQQQVQTSTQEKETALGEAEQVKQMAMQNAQSAHTAATGAMMQTLQAQKESLQQAQLATGMRDAVQGVKSRISQLVQEQLPPATNREALAASAEQAQETQPSQPAVQPGASGAAAPANAVAAGNDMAGPANSPEAAATQPAMMSTAQPSSDLQQQQQPPPGAVKAAAFLNPRAQHGAIGMLAGAALGAGIAAITARKSNEPLRQDIKKLENSPDTFLNAMRMAQKKLRLSFGELEEKHPTASTLLAGLSGAATGLATGQAIARMRGVRA